MKLRILCCGLLFLSLKVMAQDAMEKIKERGYLIGAVFPNQPLFSYQENGNYQGFNVDLGRELAERLLGDRNAIRFVNLNSGSDRILKLKSKEVDVVLVPININPQRRREIGLSEPLVVNRYAILSSRKNPITSEEDLKNARVLAFKGSQAERLLRKEYQVQHLLQCEGSSEECIQNIVEDKADAFVNTHVTIYGLANIHPDLTVSLAQFGESSYSALGVAKEENEFLNWINEALLEMKQSGKLKELYEKHLQKSYQDFITFEDFIP